MATLGDQDRERIGSESAGLPPSGVSGQDSDESGALFLARIREFIG